MEVQIVRANITDDERNKILHEVAILAGILVKGIREKERLNMVRNKDESEDNLQVDE